MKRGSVVLVIGITIIVFNGCVMNSTYESAVADLEGTKAELESVKSQQQFLAQEVKTLETITTETTREAEVSAAALQQAKDEDEAERKAAQDRIAILNRRAAQLTSQTNSLHLALQLLEQERPALRSSVDMYKEKLLEQEGLRTSAFPPPPFPQTNDPAGLTSSPSSQPSSAQPSAGFSTPPDTSSTAPPDSTAAPTSSQPASKKAAESDEGFFSAIKGWLKSLWRSVFS